MAKRRRYVTPGLTGAGGGYVTHTGALRTQLWLLLRQCELAWSSPLAAWPALALLLLFAWPTDSAGGGGGGASSMAVG